MCFGRECLYYDSRLILLSCVFVMIFCVYVFKMSCCYYCDRMDFVYFFIVYIRILYFFEFNY